MHQLKKELDAARKQLELQKRELDQNRIVGQTLEQAMGPYGEDVGASNGNKKAVKITQQTSFAASPSGYLRADLNPVFEPQPIANYNGSQNIWSAPRSPLNLSPSRQQVQPPMALWPQTASAVRPMNARNATQGVPPPALFPQQQIPNQRILSGPPSPGTIGDGRFPNDFSQYQAPFGPRRHNLQNPRHDVLGPQQRNNGNGWPIIDNGIGGLQDMSIGMNPNNPYQTMGMYPSAMPYQPRPIGTPLSPTANEFRADESPVNPWNATVSMIFLKPSSLGCR